MWLETVFPIYCLFVSISASYTSPVGPNEVKTLTGATAHGSAVTISNMDWDPNMLMPNQNWYVTAWVQIKPDTADTAKLLQFKGFDGAVPVECYATWTSTASPTFTFGATAHAVTGNTVSRQENVWFHLLMGSQAGTSFGYITFRAATSNQVSVTWSETTLVKFTSTLLAPANANPFNVIST